MRSLGPVEREVMQVLWSAAAPLTGHEVLQALGREDMAYTTLLTVLERLRAKEYLTRSREGRSYRFQTTSQEADFVADQMSRALSGSANKSGALLRFADQLDPSEAAALRAALDAMDAE